MAEVILVTGGTRSGKSSFAESLVHENRRGEEVFYVATAASCDEEMEERIRRHRERRPADWKTVETYRGFDVGDFTPGAYVLLECLGTLTTNFFMDIVKDYDHMTLEEGQLVEEKVTEAVDVFLEATRKCRKVIIVTNEIGLGVIPLGAGNRYYGDILGRLNQRIATGADKVYLCISGIPLEVK